LPGAYVIAIFALKVERSAALYWMQRHPGSCLNQVTRYSKKSRVAKTDLQLHLDKTTAARL